jgi:hypothetical protein
MGTTEASSRQANLPHRGSSARPGHPPGAGVWIHSTRLHLVLFSLLLVATPFVLLRNFLVDLIGQISGAAVPWLGTPLVPTAALLLLLVVLIVVRLRVPRRVLIALAVVLGMDALSQQIADYYFGHRFYDLQQNWHYIAYGIFGYMAYRDLHPRRYPLARIMWGTWLAALAFSCFDEGFQMKMSARVFDACDIAKDGWGCAMGMVLIYLGGSQREAVQRGLRRFARTTWSGMFGNPGITLALIVAMDLIFLNVSSLLSDTEHLPEAAIITAGLIGALLLVLGVVRSRLGRRALLAAAAAALLVQGWMLIRHHDDNISYNRFGLTVYEGVPIPFFDLLVHPDGSFRLVDKKHYFNLRDQDFFLKEGADVLLVGTGAYGRGGQGFLSGGLSHFVYNPHLGRATQVILQTTPEACRTFNRLKQERKRVVFVLHNTC